MYGLAELRMKFRSVGSASADSDDILRHSYLTGSLDIIRISSLSEPVALAVSATQA